MRAWPADSLNARVWRMLQLAGKPGLPLEDMYGKLKAPRNSISMCLWRLSNQGYVERIEGQLGWWRLPEGGLVPSIVGVETAAGEQRASDKPALGLGDIAVQAAGMLKTSASGLDSDDLALRIGCTAEEVDRALLPALEDRMLVTCGVLRGGRSLQHYRLSSGGVATYDWRKQTQATWLNRGHQLEGQLAARRGVAAPVVPPPAAPAPYQVTFQAPAAPAPVASSPVTAPVAPVAPAVPPAEVASEVVEPAAPVAPAAPVPFVGELDIDAVHRRDRTEHGVSAEEKAAVLQAPVAAEEKFECALFNDGRLLVVSNGRQMDLPVEHTRKLLHYLDHLRGDAVVEAALGELHA